MLDLVTIFSKKGVVLWSHTWAPVKGDPVNAVIHQVLLEVRQRVRVRLALPWRLTRAPAHNPQDRAANDQYQDANYSAKWVVDNEMDIVVVAVYQRVLQLAYVDDLLTRAKDAFVKVLRGLAPSERDDIFPHASFTPRFTSLQSELEKTELETRKAKTTKVPRAFTDSKKFANTKAGNKQSCAVGGGDKPSSAGGAAASDKATGGAADGGDAAASASAEAQEENGANDGELSKDQIAANIAKMRAGGGGPPGARKKKGGGGDKDKDGEEGGGKKGKEARKWDGDDATPKNLDFSKKDAGGARARVFKGKAVDLDEQFGMDDDEEEDDEVGEAVGGSSAGAGKAAKSGGMFSALRGLVGAKALERSDLDGVMDQLHLKLTEKNVAQDIGGQICESVCSSLLGKQLGSFGSLRQTVRSAMEDTLTRILTPSKRIDLLAAAAAAREKKQPYTIVFVGVNGVGKSTSLSKVAYYLKTNGFTPMLCACDTFRAGAVEQLRVHAQSLELPLFEKGYGRDAAGIATDGIKYAGQMGYDVVMVDTAGRMQDNEPLMRSLSKLVTLNNPDLVLFVGEALVGNEAVDQVRGFNTALAEFSASRQPRLIDGIMLTKFDTISDKVGAALSLVYTTGKPIVFVGVGQTYTDIRNLNVDHCVKALLRS